MIKTNRRKLTIPESPQPFHVSRAAAGMLFATLLLIALLAFSTRQNINRAQLLMESFLHDKAATIVRSIEAGSRASRIMMHHMNGVDPLHTLIIENSKGEDILFIRILDVDGSVIEQAGYPETVTLSKSDIESMIKSDKGLSRFNHKNGVFIFSKLSTIGDYFYRMRMSVEVGQQGEEQVDISRKIISIGILTEQFDIARKQDVHHAMFMGALLLLVGSAGLYAFFLYHKMRLTGASLANMKLYTDSIIESIPLSLMTLDAENRIVSSNKNTEGLFGYPIKDLQKIGIQEILLHCREAITQDCRALIEHPIEGRHKDGNKIPLRISCSPLCNPENDIIGKVLILRDMTTMRNLENQLERSRTMAALGKMAAGIAHEIRNPLGTLRGFAQFFGGQTNTGEDNSKYSELMVSEIDRLNNTVSGLLQFARPREPKLKNVVIYELFMKTKALMEADIASHNVSFHCESNCKVQVKADPDLMLQVLMNLLKNSVNASSPGTRISLHCTEDKHHIRISVSDKGCGMSEEEQEKMFDPFFTTTRTGTGLGLAVSHRIIEQHHGKFKVASEKGQGTKITIILPK